MPLFRLFSCLGLAVAVWLMTVCGPAFAESNGSPNAPTDRRFAQTLCLEFVNEYVLPPQAFEGTTVGGLSAITYDRQTEKFYALSDQHFDAEAHFYQLDLDITENGIESAEVEAVTYLSDAAGERYSGRFDPEGMALTPQGSLFISSEGDPETELSPGVTEFDLGTGQAVRSLPIPQRFQPEFEAIATADSLPDLEDATNGSADRPTSTANSQPQQIKGVQPNQGFESLTLGMTGATPGEPLNLFVATEGPLVQDKTVGSVNGTPRNRFLHYYLLNGLPPNLLGEYVYELEPAPASLFHGLSEVLALDGKGHFLALERALTPLGFQAKLFQFTLAGASDVSNRPMLRSRMRGVQAIAKQLVINLAELGISLDNLEGMTWGPVLPDGQQSLILISDDNFKSFEKTQLLLFKVSLN